MNARTKRTRIASSTPPPLPVELKTSDPDIDVEKPAGNASRPLDKSAVRRKAHADQAVLQNRGPNALPVSDYPLKDGDLANTLDKEERDHDGNRQD